MVGGSCRNDLVFIIALECGGGGGHISQTHLQGARIEVYKDRGLRDVRLSMNLAQTLSQLSVLR